MKKILALLCGLVFASGAWAATYDFYLQLNGVPKEDGDRGMSGDTKWFLIDTSAGAGNELIIAYGQVGLIQGGTSGAGGYADSEYYTYTPPTAIHHDATQVDTGTPYGTIKSIEHTVASETIQNMWAKDDPQHQGSRDVKFLVSFDDLGNSSLQETIGNRKYLEPDNLVAVLYDPNGSTIFPVATDVSIQQTSGSSGSSVTIMSSTWVTVPEPTSGLLLLLGVAGLALRRKRTA